MLVSKDCLYLKLAKTAHAVDDFIWVSGSDAAKLNTIGLGNYINLTISDNRACETVRYDHTEDWPLTSSPKMVPVVRDVSSTGRKSFGVGSCVVADWSTTQITEYIEQVAGGAAATASLSTSTSTAFSVTNSAVASLSTSYTSATTSASSAVASLSTSTSSAFSSVTSSTNTLSTSTSAALSSLTDGANAAASSVASAVASLSTSTSAALSSATGGAASVASAVASLSTSTSVGLSAANSNVSSLSTTVDGIVAGGGATNAAITAVKSSVASLSTSTLVGLSTTNSNVSSLSTRLDTKADLVGGFVPSAQIPGTFDDVINAPTLSDFPAVGEVGKVYVAEDSNKTYRWGGTVYVPLGGDYAITVKDEGTILTTALTDINFTGPGVSTTNSGSMVTVSISSSVFRSGYMRCGATIPDSNVFDDYRPLNFDESHSNGLVSWVAGTNVITAGTSQVTLLVDLRAEVEFLVAPVGIVQGAMTQGLVDEISPTVTVVGGGIGSRTHAPSSLMFTLPAGTSTDIWFRLTNVQSYQVASMQDWVYDSEISVLAIESQ